jgi:hypothetical protein
LARHQQENNWLFKGNNTHPSSALSICLSSGVVIKFLYKKIARKDFKRK